MDAALHHARHRLREHVVSLLVCEPPDGRADHRPRRRIEADFLLERRLARCLPREILRGVMLGDEGILLRAPTLVVDAVHDAGQVALAVAQEPFQTGADLVALHDLPRVRRRHRGQLFGEDEAGLHEIELAVELERVRVEEVRGQLQLAHRIAGEDALVRHVVDGEHAAGADGRRPACPAALDDQGHQRPLPVVGVDGVGDEVPLPRRFQRSGAEQGEPLVVVAVVLGPLAVELTAIVPGVLQEQIPQALRRGMHVDVRSGVQVGELHLDPPPGIPQAELWPIDDAVAGDDDHHVVPAPGQRPRKRSDHVAQPARLHVGRRLGRDEEDLHGKTSVCRRKLAASSGGVGLM